MKILRVEGTLVATARIGSLDTRRLLVVRESGSKSKQVAVDPVGCKPGDWVIAVGSSAARDAAGTKDYPSDLTIVGIIDYWDEDTPEEERPEQPDLLIANGPLASVADTGDSGDDLHEESELLIVERAPASVDGEARP